MRDINQIAQEIKSDWKNVYFGAVPYLSAMRQLTDMQSMYGQDSASSILSYFLANAGTWRGEVAKRVKAEINMGLKAYYKRNESKQIKSILTLLESSIIKEFNNSTQIREVRRTDAIEMIVEVLNHTNSDDVESYLNQVVNQSMKYGKYRWKVIGDEEMMGEADEKDPCWDGYHKLGMKDKGGKKVPNCVKESVKKKVVESVHHSTYHCFCIDKNFNVVNVMDVSNDLAADGYMEQNTGYNRNKSKYLFALGTTDSRWKSMADEVIIKLKAGELPKEIMEEYN